MKKILSLLLSIVLIISAFSACSSKNNKDDEFKLSYTYDSYYNDIDENAVKQYKLLCDAIVNYQESALIDLSELESINKLYYTSFPLTVLVKKLALSEEGDGIKIEYANDKETHNKIVSDFKDKTFQIMKECGYMQANSDEYLLNVYSYISSKTVYDEQCTSVYEVITNGKGNSSSFAGAFEYLLLQNDIFASHIYGLNSNGVSFMTLADFQGEKYLFAPYNEYKSTGGFGLSYFAMSYNDALELGFTSGFNYSNEEAVTFDKQLNNFKSLRQTFSYDYENKKITAVKDDGSSVDVKLK